MANDQAKIMALSAVLLLAFMGAGAAYFTLMSVEPAPPVIREVVTVPAAPPSSTPERGVKDN